MDYIGFIDLNYIYFLKFVLVLFINFISFGYKESLIEIK